MHNKTYITEKQAFSSGKDKKQITWAIFSFMKKGNQLGYILVILILTPQPFISPSF